MSSNGRKKKYTRSINYIEDFVGADVVRDVVRVALTKQDLDVIEVDTPLDESLDANLTEINGEAQTPADWTPYIEELSDLADALQGETAADELRARLLAPDSGGTLQQPTIEALDTAIAAGDYALVSYLARALNSVDNDELISRVTDSTGTQIDPLNQDALQAQANDELRSRLFGPDSAGTLQQTNVEALDTGLDATDFGMATYLARALQSLKQDEIRTDDAAGEIASLQADQEYTAAHRVTGVADGSTFFTVVISNPDGSGVSYAMTPSFVPVGESYLNYSEDITIDTAGTSMSWLPKDVMSGTTPALNAEYGGSYTINGGTLNTILPGSNRSGGPTASQSTESPASSGVLLEPGDSVLYEVINQSGGQGDASVALHVREA